jgi:hypothetical protein
MRYVAGRGVCNFFNVLAGAVALSLNVGQKVVHVVRDELLSMARHPNNVAMRRHELRCKSRYPAVLRRCPPSAFTRCSED